MAFFMDKMYLDLTKSFDNDFKESVHLESFPNSEDSKIDNKLSVIL